MNPRSIYEPTCPSYHRDRMRNDAVKMFEEAGRGPDFFIPGVSEKYEELAVDFLENWILGDVQGHTAT